jgi:Ca2+-binding RTX toxin-like protein
VRVSSVVAGLAAGLLAGAAPGLPIAAPALAGGSPAAAACHGQPATIVGTDDHDRLVGTSGVDVIAGLRGDDRIRGRGGDDLICGGPGSDDLDGGHGDDRVLGQPGLDHIGYGAGRDLVDGGVGDDELNLSRASHGVRLAVSSEHAEFGATSVVVRSFSTYRLTRLSDRFVGSDADETVRANAGDDVVDAGAGEDFVYASKGDDRVDGGRGFDFMFGGGGTDRIVDLHGHSGVADGSQQGGAGIGVVRTGSARDKVFVGPWGRVRVDTGAGRDDVTVDHRLTAANVETGTGDDRVALNGSDYSGDVVVRLQSGDDTVGCTESCGGAMVFGGTGVNRLDARTVGIDLTVQLGADGFVMAPTLLGLRGFTVALTGYAADVVTGSSRPDRIETGDGDDQVDGRAGDDRIDAGPGSDTVDGGDGNDICVGAETPTACEVLG